MKKLIMALATLAIFIIGGNAYAGGLTLSIEHERMFNREMVYQHGTAGMTFGEESFSGDFVGEDDSIANSKMDSEEAYLKASFKINPKIDVFAKLGVAKVDWEHDYVSTFITEKETFSGDNNAFAWGVGADIELIEISAIKLNLDGQYVAWESDGQYKIDGTDLAQYITEGMDNISFDYTSTTKVKKWHVGLRASTTMGRFSPYAGVRYSDVRIENKTEGGGTISYDDTTIPFSLRAEQTHSAEKNVGIILGTAVNLTDSLSLNIEGRAIDETSLKTSLAYHF